MKRVCGYVLVRETNSGIPNLVINAYDAEEPIEKVIGERLNEGPSFLRSLGKRIGSAITDQNGQFSLNSANFEFPGNELRPDLLILVLAPEDIQCAEKPYPLPPEKRILYISTVPRTDAGAEEAFVIRLLQEQLDHFKIPATTSTSESIMGEERLARAIESGWDFRDRLRDRLRARLCEERDRSEQFQSDAQQKVGHLSAIPGYLKDDGLTNNRLLINGKKELAANLKVKQDQTVKNGLKRLKTRNTVVHLSLTESELRVLGLEVENGNIVGSIVLERFTELVRGKIGGLDLVRKRGMSNPSAESLIKKYLLTAQVPGNGEEDGLKDGDLL